MKRFLVIAIAAVMVSGVSALAADHISGTPHDFSYGAYNTGANAGKVSTTIGDVCGYCHTPHFGPKGSAMIVPLWSHATTTTTGWIPYSSPTTSVVGGTPTGVSLACLSCHDGTLGIGHMSANSIRLGGKGTGVFYAGDPAAPPTYGNGGIDSWTSMLPSYMNIGGTNHNDLSNTHPISVAYPATSDFVQPAPANLTFNGNVECGSCHSVHDDTNGFFLADTLDHSQLCLDCHVK